MVDEREDRYDDEEGEYHFSDDQLNYEEIETPKAAQSTGTIKKSFLEKISGLSPTRRMLIASVVFMSLIAIVYKMLLPGSTTLPTDIQVVSSTKPMPQAAVKPAPPPIIKPQLPIVATTPAESVQINTPVQTPQAISQTGVVPVGMPNSGPSQTVQNTSPISTYPATQPAAPVTSATQPPIPTSVPPPLQQISTGPTPVPQSVTDRVKAVEDHNTAIMNLLQTEYAQKLSDFEMQSNLIRGKMDEMSKRINRIETSLNQITQMLQQNPAAMGKAQPMPSESGVLIPNARPSPPKNIYTVQAIIPGRAWLKADSGDTVTVAEGDTLRDYGRISKIDPYDGVVEIDTGSKIIALSYGMNGE